MIKVEQGHIPNRVVISAYKNGRRIYCNSVSVEREEWAISQAEKALTRAK